MEEIDEDVLSKNEKIYSIILIIFISLFIFFFIKNFFLYIISTVIYSIPFFLYRFYYVLKMYFSGQLRISIIPKIREERRRAFRTATVFFVFIFLPLLLLYLLPSFVLWVVETLSLVSSWLFSNVLGLILIKRIEREHKGKLIRYYIVDEILDEVIIKEYGYKIVLQ